MSPPAAANLNLDGQRATEGCMHLTNRASARQRATLPEGRMHVPRLVQTSVLYQTCSGEKFRLPLRLVILPTSELGATVRRG